MEDSKRINKLIKNRFFTEAKNVAAAAKFPKDKIAEISKKHADYLYDKNKDYNDAIT